MLLQKTIQLSIGPFSINQMFTLRNYKTASYKKWQEFFIHEMLRDNTQSALAEIREFFDPKKHAMSLKLQYYFPKSVLFNSSGTLSSRSFDLSNIEKNVIDLLCLPRTHEAADDWGAPNMNLDDKNIVRLVSEKSHSPDGTTFIVATINIIDLETVKSLEFYKSTI